MARRRHSLGWQLAEKDPVAVPNARIALALLRCVRKLPGMLGEHSHDDFGEAIAPAVRRYSKELQRALFRHRAVKSNEVDFLDLDDDKGEESDPLLKRTVLSHIGLGASKHLPHFVSLLDKVDAGLQRFVDRHSHPSDNNIRLLADMLELPAPEVAFLTLATALCHGTIDRSLFSFIDSAAALSRVQEVICGPGTGGRLRMFDSTRPLANCGLFSFSRHWRDQRSLDDLLALSLVGQRLLSVPFADPLDMSKAVLDPLPAPRNPVALEWPHLSSQQALLRSALQGALARNTPGFNVLIHGVPGTGKTEFVRQLLVELGANGYQVAHTDNGGEEASRADRLSSLKLHQTFASRQQRAVLVLDEAEDIFSSDYQHPLSRIFNQATESKAWTNNLLESNVRPVVWICNQVQHVDPAYLRRFSFCIEFPRSPFAQRLRVAQEHLLPVGCTEPLVEKIAACETLEPAVVASAARLAGLGASSAVHPDQAARMMIEGYCQATGQPAPREFARAATRFDVRYLNLGGGMTPAQVVDAMAAEGCANVLFHGPSGTGKTQFAAEIAKQLGRRLVVRTASDLNSMWYGESEANVARMFKECDVGSELLFLDEAEVLLGERERAGQRVDRAVTAEFLRWLEAFGGLFICATNHADGLDRALMRRFVYRVGFEPLDAAQRAGLLAELAMAWRPTPGQADPPLADDVVRRLSHLDQLTVGDFANVARRLRGRPGDVHSWLRELAEEQAAKDPSSRGRIGFL